MPILGQVALKDNYETGKSGGVGTLHGVRRITGGTVIYYSIGYPTSNQGSTNILGLDKSSTRLFAGEGHDVVRHDHAGRHGGQEGLHRPDPVG